MTEQTNVISLTSISPSKKSNTEFCAIGSSLGKMVSWLLSNTRQKRFVFPQFLCDVHILECLHTLPFASCSACRGQHRRWVQPADSDPQLDQPTPYLQKRRWFIVLREVIVCSSDCQWSNHCALSIWQGAILSLTERCQPLEDIGSLIALPCFVLPSTFPTQNISF